MSIAFPPGFGQSCHVHHPETSGGTASHQAVTAKPSGGVGSRILEKQKRESMSVVGSSSLEKSWELQRPNTHLCSCLRALQCSSAGAAPSATALASLLGVFSSKVMQEVSTMLHHAGRKEALGFPTPREQTQVSLYSFSY